MHIVGNTINSMIISITTTIIIIIMILRGYYMAKTILNFILHYSESIIT